MMRILGAHNHAQQFSCGNFCETEFNEWEIVLKVCLEATNARTWFPDRPSTSSFLMLPKCLGISVRRLSSRASMRSFVKPQMFSGSSVNLRMPAKIFTHRYFWGQHIKRTGAEVSKWCFLSLRLRSVCLKSRIYSMLETCTNDAYT